VERFVPAGELTLDDSLVDSQGRPIAIDAIRVTDRLITVYNLRVADFHTYFVGGKLWKFDAWVHNASYVQFKRWKRGEAIDKPMSDGSAPSWSTVQSRYWKNRYEASKLSGEFTLPQLREMRRGNAPMDYNPRTGNWERRELHHVVPQQFNGNNSPLNLRELTPDWHAEVDPLRRVPGIIPNRGIR
jgi:hypothetical protein